MGIFSALSSVAAGYETAADRRDAGQLDSAVEQSTTSTADLPWPTAITG